MKNQNSFITFGSLRPLFDSQFIIELSFTKSNKVELTPIYEVSHEYDKSSVYRIYEAKDTIGILLNGAPKSDKNMTVNEVVELLNIHQPISFAFNGVDGIKTRYEYNNPSNIPEIFKDINVVSIDALVSINGRTGFEFTLDCDPPIE